jgi:hypothetical protein
MMNSKDKAHALLSASGAERWMTCTASPRFEEQFAETTSGYAEEGRHAHSIAELKVLKRFTTALNQRQFTDKLRKLKKDPMYTEEMDRTTDSYIEHLNEKAMAYDNPPLVNSEVRVDFSDYVPEGFGTCDCVMIGGDTLDITDYKHGVGVTVYATGNPQMRLYALGALAKFDPFYGGMIQKVRMTVFQPRAMNEDDRITSETLTVDELKAWGESIKPIAQKAFAGFGEFVPGDHCRFCRGRAQCRARADGNTALEDFKDFLPPTAANVAQVEQDGRDGIPTPNLLTDAEIGDLLVRGANLLAWFKDIEEYALNAILNGGDIPGWKAVAGRSNRTFTDHDAAAKAVISAGYDEALVYERKPHTLTALEKLMGAKDFAEKIGAFIYKPPGKPTLAPLSDKREPYSSAASDFAGATQGEATAGTE